jgi:hypothetical protein
MRGKTISEILPQSSARIAELHAEEAREGTVEPSTEAVLPEPVADAAEPAAAGEAPAEDASVEDVPAEATTEVEETAS